MPKSTTTISKRTAQAAGTEGKPPFLDKLQNNLFVLNITRQIRNAFQTAIALAEFHAAETHSPHHHSSKPTHLKIELGKKHFLTVTQASKDFDNYLKRTLGQNEADIARNEQTRLDDYDLPKVVRRAQGKKKKKVVENVESEESEGDSEDEESGSVSESEEVEEVVQVVKKVVKKRGR
jgi:alpha-galactosidase/6-phospho-beta-glucosidase family protein